MKIDEELREELENLNSISANIYHIAYDLDCFIGGEDGEEETVTKEAIHDLRRSYAEISAAADYGIGQADKVLLLMQDKLLKEKNESRTRK